MGLLRIRPRVEPVSGRMGHDSLNTELIYYCAECFILGVSSQSNLGLHFDGNSDLI